MIVILALLIGVVAGLRALTAPAVVAWAAFAGWLDLSQTSLAFMGYKYTPWVFSVLAVVELVTDQLPSTPSRKVPPQFGARIVLGALAGATIGASRGSLVLGLVAGIVGAVIGTFGGAAARAQMARSFGSDRPAAIVEDIVAILGAIAIAASV
jgi:uncharacterized membrane protein